ncbi:MAG: pantetheine-phosphate adenylyltransferase [Candidatus Marinimicrobia bacterium]|nr:pantetheine-phosphate adenylyltransferase [Candidatus Neomarinimicrobiota bacterium]MCH8304822.1 pantetheine-phosphate adenylyltransferase [Candidatus Neomarinimicrobiota bacterium]TFB10101.1 pantetheine-phosphate adenylyltransferase [Candidatus Marinimicrobia bacterium MT.SAG.2]
MKIAVYPGTFDPITNGHVDIIKRSAKLFDKIIVTVAVNTQKIPLFNLTERAEMIHQVLKNEERIEVDQFDGLIAEYLKRVNASAMIRGLRAVSDFEFEFQMSLMNRKLNPDVETVFLTPAQEYIHLNSTIVKEVASFGGDVSEYVPDYVKAKLQEKFKK